MFDPDYSSHPGDTLLDMLEERKMSQAYLAWALGYSTKHIWEVIHGKKPISLEMALRLEKELGVDAEFWLTRQMRFDLFQARLRSP